MSHYILPDQRVGDDVAPTCSVSAICLWHFSIGGSEPKDFPKLETQLGCKMPSGFAV